MKKKIIALSITAVLIISAVVGGTFAYLTDKDYAENTMVMGNVNIEQNEWERNEAGELVAFTQDKPLYPAVNPSMQWDDNAIVEFSKAPVSANGGSQKMFVEPNAVDKFVTVTNTGKSDAYVRTLVAIECGSLSAEKVEELVGISYYDRAWTIATELASVTIDGHNYKVYEFVYTGRNGENGVLAKDETTQASLCQVYLASATTNEDCIAIDGNGNGKYDILALSQAVQTNGFDDAQTALDTAFGDVSAANVQAWFTSDDIPEYVSSAEEIADAVAAGKNVVLTKDLTATTGQIMIPAGSIFDGGNKTIVASGTSTKAVLSTTGGTVKNVVLSGKSTSTQGLGAGMTNANPLVEDLYIDNVTIDHVMYAVIGTANDGVTVFVNDSTLNGSFSYVGADVVATDSVFGVGTSMYDFYEVGGNATFTNCSFMDSYCFLAYADAAGSTVTFNGCNVNGTALTAANFKDLLVDTRWDYSSDLSSANLANINIVVDGVAVQW